MSKKIIAVALALVCVATVFTACHQKLNTYKIGGKDVAVVTDVDGNIVIDDENRLCAIVTDREGEIVTYENKEPQTYWIQLDNSFVADNTVYTPVFVMKGLDGWEFNPLGAIEKKKTNGQCQISCSLIMVKDYEDKNLDEYLEYRDELNVEAKALYEKEGYKISVEKKAVEVTADKIPMVYYKEIIYNPDGTYANYSESLYFQYGKTTDKYCIQYKSANGVGVDDKFDFIEFVNSNFTVRPEKEETTTVPTSEAK